MIDTVTKSSAVRIAGQWSGRLMRTLERKRVGLPPGEDWLLWQKARVGHAASATALVSYLTPPALGLAMQLLRKTEDAQDVVQESFMRLWRGQPSDARGAQLSTYFNTIVINRCKSHLTQRREFSFSSDDLVDIADAQQQTDTGSETAMSDVTTEQLQRAMASLVPRQRLALAMWAYGDADITEIAHTLEIDANAAHQLLHRAKLSLRKAINGGSL